MNSKRQEGRVPVQTTDGTSVVAQILALPDNGVTVISMTVIAREGGANRAIYKRTALFSRDAGGGAILQGTVADNLTVESNPAWGVGIVANGNDVNLMVTGLAGVTVDWLVLFKTVSLK